MNVAASKSVSIVDPQVVSYVRDRQETIDWLTANGYPALPVAPRQDPHINPAIVETTG